MDSELGVDESVVADDKIARMLASGKQSELSNGTPLLPGEELGQIPTDSEIFGLLFKWFLTFIYDLMIAFDCRQNRSTTQ